MKPAFCFYETCINYAFRLFVNNFQDAFGRMRGIDHFVRVMLQIGAGHGNNCQVKLKLFGYDIQIQFQANLEVSEALIIYVTNRGGGRPGVG